MKILLASNASYAPPRGGSTRSNLIWLGYLADSGHECRVVCASLGESQETVSEKIHITSVNDFVRNVSVLRDQIRELQPDWVLVSSEDVSHVLLREAHRVAAGRIVYLAHTPQFYPFGPASWNADPAAADIVRGASSVVAIGHYMAAYIEQHLGRPAAVVHPPIYGTEPYAQAPGFGRGSILMINPCVVKGISIFIALAKHFHQHRFTALAGWGTTQNDRKALAALSNINVLESVPNIGDVLSEAKLLLMPSLWVEGFGLIAMEAMLRGLPVVASDSGGLVEAKKGTGFVIPIRPIESFEAVFDENFMPKPVGVAQDIAPWIDALNILLTDRTVYEAEAEGSRAAALQFVRGLHAGDLEKLLISLQPKQVTETKASRPVELSSAKRALLLQKLRQSAPGH